ncbi:hypothetical protein WN944_029520 [Citrus x changshan-huyou]|uniref:Uncharacterized protein n=1 Tax=Citrus x changshan-huyou TaxID=2935761 RepID=A0AAP0QB64_9ROSI
MGIVDRGLNVEAKGDMQEVGGYLKRFEVTFRDMHIKKLEDILCKSTRADDEFKVKSWVSIIGVRLLDNSLLNGSCAWNDIYLFTEEDKVTLYEKQIKGCSNGGRKRYLEKGGNNKLLNREWRQYLKCTKRGLKVVRGGLGEHRGMESENEEVNEIVESNGLKVEQLPLNIDNCGEGKVR